MKEHPFGNVEPSHYEKGVQLAREGKHLKAIDRFNAEISSNGRNWKAYIAMAFSLRHMKLPSPDFALHFFRKALVLFPEKAAEINGCIGQYHLLRKQPDIAWDFFEKAIHLSPDSPEVLYSMGFYYLHVNDFEKALACVEKSLALKPEKPFKVFVLASNIHFERGDIEEALRCLDQALTLKPDSHRANAFKSEILLSRGRIPEAWEGYRYRQVWVEIETDRPLWDGSPLNGRTLLVCWEQGYGDNIQFVRYLNSIRGGKVVYYCRPALRPLFLELARRGWDVDFVSDFSDVPPFDCWVPLLSLPAIFETSMDTIPRTVPYLFASPDKARRRKSAFPRDRYRIGFAWSGNPEYSKDHNRSCRANCFNRLFEIPKTRWYILQESHVSTEGLEKRDNVESLARELTDFSETAAIIANLDLVISVDTAVAHLTGALGKPVWVLSRYAADWRWLSRRGRSPWYPTARLFRQSAPGDWEGVFARVERELAEEVSGKAGMFRPPR